ncbi:hypothetical protein BRE01_11540 [Brevibacillus reuszeri]|uniref:ABC transporter permease n=3 Tax=Brevibacillus reuszeri TaxID=54915 RepID=A0ABQ0THW7_9BACL|nr:hypothetical protein BRE01_11540 [Brevibacillus reuszeri]
MKKVCLILMSCIIFLTGLNEFLLLKNTVKAAVNSPELYDVAPGFLDKDKKVMDSGKYKINGLAEIDKYEQMNVSIADVKVQGTKTGSGQVLNYTKNSTTSDNGYPVVDLNEARAWASIFNGNPSFISYSNGLNEFYVQHDNGEDIYTGYLLSQIAEMSGGSGLPYTTIPYTSSEYPNQRYKGVVNFETSPQPKGGIGIGSKSQYKVGDTVQVNMWAEDFSFFNRGIKVLNYYIYNVDTQVTEHSFSSEIKKHSAITNGDYSKGGPGNPYHIEVSGQQYISTKPGNYEARLLITDLHDRNSQNASSLGGTGVPYKVPFKVGDAPPPDPENPDPGPSCTIDSSKTKMDINVDGDKDVKDYTAVSSGSSIAVEKNATISIFAKKQGTFKMDGVEMPTYKGDRKTGVKSVGSSGSYKVVYTSDDGTECWEKTFTVINKGGEDKCPIITLSNATVRNGDTIEIFATDKLYFHAKYTDKDGTSGPALVMWDVTRPNGSVVTLPGQYDDRDRWRPYNSEKLNLPWGNGRSPDDVVFERGKTYKIKLNYSQTDWDKRPECNWEITIKVRNVACEISDQNALKAQVYGNPPNPFSPAGDEVYQQPGGKPSTLYYDVYFKWFTMINADSYDTNMRFSANAPGTWYLLEGDKRTALTGKLAANEQFDLIIPADLAESFGEVLLEFESDKGCLERIAFTVKSDRKCYNILVSSEVSVSDQKWSKEIKRGETIELSDADYEGNYRFSVFTSGDTHYLVNWFDPDDKKWKWKRNGQDLGASRNAQNKHHIYFPTDTNKRLLEGLYMVEVYDKEGCSGFFFVKIGSSPLEGENLLIIKSSFTITPNSPQEAGIEATITFDVKNEGKLSHNTKLAVRWESSAKETVLDVNEFKPGEIRKITVPTQYPQKSENFIANINPSKNLPDNETIWSDNRALWPVKVVGGGDPELPEPKPPDPPDPEGPGGDMDGGEIGLEIYDADNRQLQKLQVNVDGVWEREPARIRVVIDQTKINEGFQRVQQEINKSITDYKALLEQSASGENIENVSVTATPGWIADAKSMAVYSPASLDLRVSGPGTPQQWQVSSTSTGGDYLYTGTIVPTQTTWRQVLQSEKYKAEINGFVITMNYSIRFDLSYEMCTTDEEENKTCKPNQISKTMTGRYTITVKGGERPFEVFEPNATGSIHHTEEWKEYHSRDRYPNSQSNDFYAGERILAQIELQPRHRHPVSNQYPVITASQAWISETGLRQTSLQSLLSLRAISPQLWKGPTYSASKLGTREQGVDIPLMGDKQHGFKKDASYAVYYQVHFRFDVNKGFPYLNKNAGKGHELSDYHLPFRIIANAWERQGIRNHTTQ